MTNGFASSVTDTLEADSASQVQILGQSAAFTSTEKPLWKAWICFFCYESNNRVDCVILNLVSNQSTRRKSLADARRMHFTIFIKMHVSLPLM